MMAPHVFNRALVFVKPHAADSTRVQPFVIEQLTRNRVTVLTQGIITGREIADRNLVDQHYAVIAEYGAVRDPAELQIAGERLEAFQETFGISWAEAEVRNAIQFQEETGLSAEGLNRLWEDASYLKLAPGLYVARLEAEDHSPRTVINGFYPKLREAFMVPDASVIWFDTRFDPDELSWASFRADVIGATNPAEAKEGSIRHELYSHPTEYDLAERPTVQLNGIHASAGALEAARERMIWLQQDAGEFPLLDALREHDVDDGTIRALLQNPMIETDDGEEPIFDVLEDTDARDALEFILDHLKK